MKKIEKRLKHASCLDFGGGGGNLLASDNNGFRVFGSGKFKVESGKLVPKAIRHDGNKAISKSSGKLGLQSAKSDKLDKSLSVRKAHVNTYCLNALLPYSL